MTVFSARIDEQALGSFALLEIRQTFQVLHLWKSRGAACRQHAAFLRLHLNFAVLWVQLSAPQCAFFDKHKENRNKNQDMDG